MALSARIKALNDNAEECFDCNGTGWYFNAVPCISCKQIGK